MHVIGRRHSRCAVDLTAGVQRQTWRDRAATASKRYGAAPDEASSVAEWATPTEAAGNELVVMLGRGNGSGAYQLQCQYESRLPVSGKIIALRAEREVLPCVANNDFQAPCVVCVTTIPHVNCARWRYALRTRVGGLVRILVP